MAHPNKPALSGNEFDHLEHTGSLLYLHSTANALAICFIEPTFRFIYLRAWGLRGAREREI